MSDCTATFLVGALCRRQMRRRLMQEGLQFQEDKGWLDSLFVVEGDVILLRNLQQWVQRINTA